MFEHSIVILPAGGTSTRFGNTNKLLCELNGMPVFCHAVRRFLQLLPAERIAISVNRNFREDFEYQLERNFPGKRFRIVNGGRNRTESVLHALELFAEEKPLYAAVHDAARPLLSRSLAEETFRMCGEHGAALAARKMTDTVKQIGADGLLSSKGVDRETLWTVETPQIFLYSDLLAATRRANAEQRAFTDDAAAVEYYLGRKVFPVENRGVNLKITHQTDLELARQYLASTSAES